MGTAMDRLAFIVLVLALARSCHAAITIRHQFQYKVSDKSKIPEIISRWNSLVANAPADGKPVLYQFGKDLGISAQLYSWTGDTNPDLDVAGRVDFDSEATLTSFWKQTYNNPKYKELLKWVDGAYRLQYFANVCSYPNAGTYFRHSFEYQLKGPAAAKPVTESGPAGGSIVSADMAMAATRLWYYACQNAPVKPASCVFGPDLGIGSELYPSNKPNLDFGGSLDFKSKEDIVAFWKWLFLQPVYQKFIKDNVVTAARIQYLATYK